MIERSGWVGFAVGVLVGAAMIVAFCIGVDDADAHGVKSRCKDGEENIKVLVNWDKENGHVHYTCVHREDYIAEFIENSYQNAAVHATVAGSVCEHRRWWERKQGITIMPEACDG